MYQEFVRYNHATRIREWITGRTNEHFGASHRAMQEVSQLLSPLDAAFRRDLGIICESHHLYDLNDYAKYKVSQPYGNSEEETANMQYCAVLLRSADLLHITRDRTPSIAFRILNPADPISQREWAKQMAVKRVRSKFGLDKEGRPSETAPRDTIEVHADFTRPDGFFGLTSYLAYAQSELQKSHQWVEDAVRTQATRVTFPWRYIDDSNITTEGFLKEAFEFQIDQAKVLDLLTGHTLYNDTSVVIRELAQNALDAIRLQQLLDAREELPETSGEVLIEWDSKARILSMTDNGTGMTQSVIENHLLKVGASRYQDPDFIKHFPDFSPISRFGIGVLSAFMVADHVEIITNHPEEQQARLLTLRSVHGKYLIQLLEKGDSRISELIQPHGTRVTLQIRASAMLPDVEETARRWIVVPTSSVKLRVDGGASLEIGYPSLKEALIGVLRHAGATLVENGEPTTGSVKVHEVEIDGVTVTYALKWSSYYREWEFVGSREMAEAGKRPSWPLLGTCIEGIRVEFSPPGYATHEGILAIANAVGKAAPKTNVARSGIELTPERARMLRCIYRAYCEHIRSEVQEMQSLRGYSLTRALQEARFVLRPLLSGGLVSFDSLLSTMEELPLMGIEHNGERRSCSLAEVRGLDSFWMIDSPFFRSAEWLIREVPSSSSLGAIVKALGLKRLTLPDEPVLLGVGLREAPYHAAFDGKAIARVRVEREERQLGLLWAASSPEIEWRSLPEDVKKLSTRLGYHFDPAGVLVGVGSKISVEGIDDEEAVQGFNTLFILPHSVVAGFLSGWLDRYEADTSDSSAAALIGVFSLFRALFNQPHRRPFEESQIGLILNQQGNLRFEPGMIDFAEVTRIANQSSLKRFDPSAYLRRDA